MTTHLSTDVVDLANDAGLPTCHSSKMNRIKELREAACLTQEQLADRIGTDKTMVSRLENGARKLTQDWMIAISTALRCSPADLIVARGMPEPLPARSPRAQKAAEHRGIAEIDVRAGMGLGGEALIEYHPDGNGGSLAMEALRGEWSIPEDYLRVELRAAPNDLRIIEVEGDSMAPTLLSGDRVMVNVKAKIPSPPGIFALWDGLGVVCKRIEYMSNTEPPRLKIISDNTRHAEYERTLEEAHIIGRVVWFSRRL
jgi:transcriptional regulator with XRE-family HTH domain